MNEQDDTKLWQLLGHASQAAPGDDFARKVMMRIAEEERTQPVPVESIRSFKWDSLPHLGLLAAALIAGVIGISVLMEPAAPEVPSYPSLPWTSTMYLWKKPGWLWARKTWWTPFARCLPRKRALFLPTVFRTCFCSP